MWLMALIGGWATALLIPHRHLESHLVSARVIEQGHELSRDDITIAIGWSAGARIPYHSPQHVIGGLATRPLASGVVIAANDFTPPAGGDRETEAMPGGVISRRTDQPLARWLQLIPPDSACGSLVTDIKTSAAKLGDCFPKLLVRVIFAGNHDCNDVAFRPGIHIPLPMEARWNPDKEAFPVTLCEGTVVDYADKAVTFQDGKAIGWDGLAQLQHVAVVGDSGCNNTKDVGQDCDSAEAWPFREVASAAAHVGSDSGRPGLVIHVGDYRYRTSTTGISDNWQNWYNDFFAPGRSLLLAAPWIMLRGNHENCFKGNGNGWFFLLQPEIKTVSRCPADADRDLDNQPPYALDMRAGEWLRLIVVDSANAKYRCDSWAQDFLDRQDARLRRLMDSGGAGGTAWLLTHYPVWDAAEDYLSNDNGYRLPNDSASRAIVRKLPLEIRNAIRLVTSPRKNAARVARPNCRIELRSSIAGDNMCLRVY
jgi:hypothetical protein